MTDNATRQLQRVGSERWLYRTDRGDYGPVTTDRILDAIREQAIDLATPVSVLGTNKWGAAGEFPLFRDHYAACKRRWEEERLHAEAEALGKRMEMKGHASRGAGILLITGIIVAIGIGTLVVWRLSKAEPIGLAKIVRTAVVTPLPKPPTTPKTAPPPPVLKERKVARLSEPESYDTAGIAVGTEVEGDHVTQMHFSDEGEVEMISAADLAAVVESARQGLYGCARDAAGRNADWSGTDVGFTVSPGHLTKVTVGADARGNAPFQACVKAALARVKVPTFGGSERRVTVPLRFQR